MNSSIRFRVVAASVTLAVAGLLIVGPAAAASAATAADFGAVAVPAVDTPDFTPSASSPRRFILNILGSVLKGATPDKWKAEQIANDHQYNYQWQSLDAQFGYSPNHLDINGNLQPVPAAGSGTYDDAVIAAYEAQVAQGGKGGKPMSVVATKPSKLTRAVGSLGTATAYIAAGVVAAQVGFATGKAVSELMGFDVDGGLCTADDGGFVAALTGTDCSFLQLNEDYIVNQDAILGVSWGSTCAPSEPLSCITIKGTNTLMPLYSCVSAAGAPTQYIAGKQLFLVVKYGSGLTGVANPSRMWGSPVDLNSPGCAVYTGGSWGPGLSGVYNSAGGSTTVNVFSGATSVAVVRATAWNTAIAAATGGFTSAVQGNPNPTRTISCEITGSNGLVYSASTAGYQESAGVVPSPVCPELPAGVVPANTQLIANGPTGPDVMSDQDATDEFLDWYAAYPECRTGACKLDLIRTTDTLSCFDLESACDGWFTDPARATAYQCRYGTHDVDLSECYVYSGTFNPDRIAVGAPYSDPMTGEWSGGQNAPTPDTQALGQGIQDPDVYRKCTGLQSTGFDPVAFVMRPVQCALEWAFVPRDAVVKLSVAGVTSAWDSTFFGDVAGIVAPFGTLPVFTGCSGMPVGFDLTWPVVWGWHFTFGEACSGVMATTATVVRTIEGAGIIFLGIRMATSYIGGVLGYRGFGSKA